MRTRSKTKKIRENVRRLPHEVEATLPSWVKCTDPIPREILEEVRSTVLVWMKNVRNYVEETETYILNDEHVHQEIVDDGWAFFVDRILCLDPLIQGGFPHNTARFDYAEGVGRFATAGGRRARGLRARTATGPYRGKVIHTGWSRFIRRMILSDVNIYRYTSRVQRDVKSVDIYVGSRHEYEDACHIRDDCSSFDQINVNFHNTLSSEIKDEICSKLASALRALKSRISRICGINELERRVSLT
mgnify:CR=1 FL=1